MNNFAISEHSSELTSAAAAAKKAGLTANKLASSADASFAYMEGDVVTIPAQVAKVVDLPESLIANLSEGSAKAFFSFDAFVTRGGKKLPCHISAKQLYTPTVWLDADDSGSKIPNREDNIYVASFKDGRKRFGEQGSVYVVNGIPVLDHDITVDMSLQSVYVPVYVEPASRPETQSGQTLLRAREAYAIAR